MTRLILFFILFFNSQFIFTQSIDSTLTESELLFRDSINFINQESQKFNKSRQSFNTALDFIKNNDLENAITYFSKAINIDSNFSQAYFERARCYEGNNNGFAIIDFNLAFKNDSSNLEPLYRIAKIQSNINLDSTYSTYDRIISIDNNQARAFHELGILNYLQNDIQNAISYFTSALKIDKNPRILNDRASCYRLIEKFDLAIDDYINAIQLNPDIPFIYNNLASTYRRNGDFQMALNYYSSAINLNPEYVIALNNRGSLHIDLNDLNSAISDINNAISLDSNYAPAYNNMGVIYFKKMDYNSALEYFNTAIGLSNNYAKAYLNRGINRQMLRDEDGACLDWQMAHQLGLVIANKYFINDCE